MGSEVWIFAEQQDGSTKSLAYELASEGRSIADQLQAELCAVCLGHNVEDTAQLAFYGVDRLYVVDDPSLANNDEDHYVSALVDLVRHHNPEVLLAGATSLGRSLIPRVAARLETGVAANCTGLDVDPEAKLLMQTRPMYGGSLMGTFVCPERKPQVATVRPHAFRRGQPDEARQAHIVRVDLDKEPVSSRTKLIDVIRDVSSKVKLEEADAVVCGGRGLGAPENFHIVENLAEVLGAALGCSRPPVDDGWVPYSHQVGQTGKTVTPKLYIACGVSGAPQHLTGMQTAEIIVAINDDPKAPIFDVATYGLVGDLFKIVPLLTAKLKEANS